MNVYRPESLAEAEDMLRTVDVTVCVGGCTSVQFLWRRGVPVPAALVSMARIDALKVCVRDHENAIRLGAAFALSDVEQRGDVCRECPAIAGTIRRIAALAVRRLGTLGGNIGSLTGCLLAMGASVCCFVDGESRDSELEGWLAKDIRARGILISVSLMPSASGTFFVHRKIGLRAAVTPSEIGVAALLSVDGTGVITEARCAVGGGIVRPCLLVSASASLPGIPLEGLDMYAVRTQLENETDAPTDGFRTTAYRKAAGAGALVAELEASLRALATPPRVTFTTHTTSVSKLNVNRLCPERRNAYASDTVAGVADRYAGAEGKTIKQDRAARSILQRASYDTFKERRHSRPDIAEKVAGTLQYVTDTAHGDMLVGRILRAGVPHARIVSIDTFDAEQLPRVVAVVTSKDIRGLNAFGILLQDQAAMCSDKVRHIGDAVAAVAAIDTETADRALALIRVEYIALRSSTIPRAHSKPIQPRSTMAATFGTTCALSAPTLSVLQRPASLS